MSSYPLHWNRIRGYIPISFCDWPGHVSSVLFSGGCNLHCPTCHNYKLAWDHESLPVLNYQIVMNDILRRKKWLSGITLSGGEPTLNEELVVLLDDLQKIGLPIKLDSNATNPILIEYLLTNNLINTVAIDVKGPVEKYKDLTKDLDSSTAESNLNYIFDLTNKFKDRIYFRCTKVPLLSKDDLKIVEEMIPHGSSLTFQDFILPKR